MDMMQLLALQRSVIGRQIKFEDLIVDGRELTAYLL